MTTQELTHEKVAVIYSALSEASKGKEIHLPLASFEAAEKTQQFINALCSATGIWYDTVLDRETFDLSIKARQ